MFCKWLFNCKLLFNCEFCDLFLWPLKYYHLRFPPRNNIIWPYWRPRQWLWRFRWLLMRSNKANNGNLEHFVKTTLKSVICLYSHQFLGKNLILKFRETAYFYLGYSADLLLTSTDHAFTLSSSLSSDCARCSPRGARRCCPLIKMLNQAWIFFIIRDLQGIALVASLS